MIFDNVRQGGHRILFLSYWSADEPLVRSTILPYLRMMSEHPRIDKVIFYTVERGGRTRIEELQGLEGVEHRHFRMRFKRFKLLSRAYLFLFILFDLVRTVRKERITMIDSKAALAGGLAYLVHRLTGVQYMVESFEPHSEYMADCMIWKRSGLFYRISRWLELEQRRTAAMLVTVTWNYHQYLLESGVAPERVRVIPSITDHQQFLYDPAVRERLRTALGWTGLPVGIYVGKFGGLYYDVEAFGIFRMMMDRIGPGYRLIILTNEPIANVHQGLEQAGVPTDRVMVKYAPHSEVPQWLSVADHAFSTIRYTPNGLYQSPVKNGEYWMSGLPILLTDGVSDDHRLIKERPWSGALFDLSRPGTLDAGINHMASLLEQGVDRSAIMALGMEFRSMGIAERVYEEIFSSVPRFSATASGT